MNQPASPQDYFRMILLTVVGQAFSAAGYTFEERPLQWANGMYRFRKPLDGGLSAVIEFQHLHYVESAPSRFRVTLIRTDQANPAAPSSHPRFARRALSALVVEDFGVAILPSTDHWWTFTNTDELGKALAEAGHLIVGFGIPWLSGELQPPA